MNARSMKGFTLVELAIVLIIFGMLVTIGTSAFVMNAANREMDQTKESFRVDRTAMTEFFGLKGRYPCPADPTLGPSDAGYGREVCGPPWGGVRIVTTGARDADGVGGPDEVLIGSIPFATMLNPDNDITTNDGVQQSSEHADGFAEARTIDGWKNKVGYAVTRSQTVATTYRDDWGAIAVKDEHARTIVEPAGSAHFVMFSYGKNGRGAHDRSGTQVDSCGLSYTPPSPPAPPPVTTALSETENCDGVDATFMNGLLNETDHSYNDDILVFQHNKQASLWNFVSDYPDPDWAGAPAQAPRILQAANMNIGFVGVQNNDPGQQLDIVGSIHSTSKIRAEKLCDPTGTDCMAPEVLGGNDPNMSCPPGDVMVGIEQNRAVCAIAPAAASPVGRSCPAGEFIVGITNLGNLICGNVYAPPP